MHAYYSTTKPPHTGIVAATEKPKVPVTLIVALAVVGFVVLFLLLTVIIIIAIMVMRKKGNSGTAIIIAGPLTAAFHFLNSVN